MKDLENEIKIEATKQQGVLNGSLVTAFIKGAKAAKEYWQQEMYNLQQVSDLIEDEYDEYLDYLLDNNRCSRRGSKTYLSFANWFEQNKKK